MWREGCVHIVKSPKVIEAVISCKYVPDSMYAVDDSSICAYLSASGMLLCCTCKQSDYSLIRIPSGLC